MEQGTLLNCRYRVERPLGERRLASTAVAIDERTGDRCVVKRLSLARVFSSPIHEVGNVSGSDAQKLIELFEREGQVLSHLDHPRIPRLIECFANPDGESTDLYLVQEYIHAPSLKELIAGGRHFTEAEVTRIAMDLAETLTYLHGRSPPLIHRDIKPSNVLYDEDRGAFLVDFGAVKDRMLQHGLDGATIVGTFDYMPLEQYQGNAVPATDIYSLGLTLISALSHQEPSQLSRDGLGVDFRPHVSVSRPLIRILERMVEPGLERRYRDARRLHADLRAIADTRSSSRFGPEVRVAIGAALALGAWGTVEYVTSLDRPGVTPAPVGVVPTTAANDPPIPVVARDGVLQINVFEHFRYVDTGWPMGLSVSQSGAPTPDLEPYETLRAEPRYRSAQPRYGYLPLGNGDDPRMTFVIDELERPTWVVYVDRNNNEDLTDDGPPLQNEGTGRFAAALSLPVRVTATSGRSFDTPYKLWLWISEHETSRGTRLSARYYARCHWAGLVDLGGTVYTAVAYEYDRHNGLYAENGLWIDLNANDTLDDDEHFADGSSFRAGGNVYRLQLQNP